MEPPSTEMVEPTVAAEPTAELLPTETSPPEAAASPTTEPTSIPEPSPTRGVSVHPVDLRTGLDDVDPVLEAVSSGDSEQIAALMRMLDTACTTADGLGGPPKCEDLPDGTIVTVFPVLGSEGTFATAEHLPELAESMNVAGLFGVYRITTGPGPEEAYWPTGDYGIVLANPDPLQATTLLVTDGHIVRIVYHYVGGPEQAFDGAGGEIVVPPLQ